VATTLPGAAAAAEEEEGEEEEAPAASARAESSSAAAAAASVAPLHDCCFLTFAFAAVAVAFDAEGVGHRAVLVEFSPLSSLTSPPLEQRPLREGGGSVSALAIVAGDRGE